MKNICSILLAAGSSSRMNYPKQLLKWKGKTLIEYQINQLRKQSFAEIIVILGHQCEKIKEIVSIKDKRVTFLTCRQYPAGLSESLKTGLSYAMKKYEGLLIMLVDMPLIQSKTIEKVVHRGSSLLNNRNDPYVVQPSYQQQPGHPVFIGHFAKIDWRDLKGDQGAKQMMRKFKDHYFIDLMDEGIIHDFDTPEEYEKALIKIKLKEK
ncbi:nucleotidyltransferase family protein [Neobacillus sp. LXY-1]|uniref:nucleotidyltransferase family protein n=1 Tax=Neobacillus sp. LXY-1 TaxID=3379133 RepID=UPI003EE2FEF9